MDSTIITIFFSIAVPVVGGLITLSYKKPDKAIILINSIKNGALVLSTGILLFICGVWWGQRNMYNEALNLAPIDFKKNEIAISLMDKLGSALLILGCFSMAVTVICWLLIQLAVFLKPEEFDKNDGLDDEN